MLPRLRTSRPSRAVWTCVVLSLLLISLSSRQAHAARDGNIAAIAVWGQPTMLSTQRTCAHPTSMTLCGPAQVTPDDQGNLWVSDLGHNRVLMFPRGSAIAGRVLGQYGSMTTYGCDQRPPHGSSSSPLPTATPFVNQRELPSTTRGRSTLPIPSTIASWSTSMRRTSRPILPLTGYLVSSTSMPQPAMTVQQEDLDAITAAHPNRPAPVHSTARWSSVSRHTVICWSPISITIESFSGLPPPSPTCDLTPAPPPARYLPVGCGGNTDPFAPPPGTIRSDLPLHLRAVLRSPSPLQRVPVLSPSRGLLLPIRMETFT